MTIVPGRGSGTIDTTNKEAVNNAYNTILQPWATTLVSTTADPNTCTPGTMDATQQQAQLNIINMLRSMNGVWGVYLDDNYNRLAQAAEPNEFHYSLAELENKVASVNVFTQNVDGLHQKAGNSQVTEMHGNANQVICIGRNSGCRRVFKTSEFDHMDVPLCPDCNIPLKPNVSLFMEGINGLAAARNSLETSDVIDCWNIVECWSS